MSHINYLPLFPEAKYRIIQEKPDQLSQVKEVLSNLPEDVQKIFENSSLDAIEARAISSYWCGDWKGAYGQLKTAIENLETKKEKYIERLLFLKLIFSLTCLRLAKGEESLETLIKLKDFFEISDIDFDSRDYLKSLHPIILINLSLVLIRVKETNQEEALFYAKKALQLTEGLYGQQSFKYLSISRSLLGIYLKGKQYDKAHAFLEEISFPTQEKKLLRVGIYYSQGNLSEAGNILEDLTSEELEDDDNSSSISATNTYVYENNEYKYIMDMYSTIEKALISSNCAVIKDTDFSQLQFSRKIMEKYIQSIQKRKSNINTLFQTNYMSPHSFSKAILPSDPLEDPFFLTPHSSEPNFLSYDNLMYPIFIYIIMILSESERKIANFDNPISSLSFEIGQYFNQSSEASVSLSSEHKEERENILTVMNEIIDIVESFNLKNTIKNSKKKSTDEKIISDIVDTYRIFTLLQDTPSYCIDEVSRSCLSILKKEYNINIDPLTGVLLNSDELSFEENEDTVQYRNKFSFLSEILPYSSTSSFGIDEVSAYIFWSLSVTGGLSFGFMGSVCFNILDYYEKFDSEDAGKGSGSLMPFNEDFLREVRMRLLEVYNKLNKKISIEMQEIVNTSSVDHDGNITSAYLISLKTSMLHLLLCIIKTNVQLRLMNDELKSLLDLLMEISQFLYTNKRCENTIIYYAISLKLRAEYEEYLLSLKFSDFNGGSLQVSLALPLCNLQEKDSKSQGDLIYKNNLRYGTWCFKYLFPLLKKYYYATKEVNEIYLRRDAVKKLINFFSLLSSQNSAYFINYINGSNESPENSKVNSARIINNQEEKENEKDKKSIINIDKRVQSFDEFKLLDREFIDKMDEDDEDWVRVNSKYRSLLLLKELRALGQEKIIF